MSKIPRRPFLVNISILDPLKTKEFLVFSGVINWEHWLEKG